MSPALLTLLILGATVVLFASDRLRVDLVALLCLASLVAAGILETSEALAGFSAPIVLMIGALFVVGEGLTHTGLAARLTRGIERWSQRDPRLLLPLLMLVAAGLSALMSSTGTVAVLLPVAVGLAGSQNRSPAALLMPMAFAAQLGGLLTLIGTPPNLVVAEALEEATGKELGFFALTPYGVLALATGIALLLLGRRWLLPAKESREDGEAAEPSALELSSRFGLQGNVWVATVQEGSPLLGKSAAEMELRKRFRVSLLAVVRPPTKAFARARALVADPHVRLVPGDVLVLKGERQDVERVCEHAAMEPRPLREAVEDPEIILEVGLVEVLLTPESRLLGRTVRDSRIHDRFGINVIAVRRRGRPLEGPVSRMRLELGDSLLICGSWPRIDELRRERQAFIVVATAHESPERLPGATRAPRALAIVTAMLGFMVFSSIPLVWVAVGAAWAMVISGAVEPATAYRRIHWPSLVMLAAMLPAGTALQNSGALALVVETITAQLGNSPPWTVLAVLMILTSLLSQVVSNTATAVLLAPVALEIASGLGLAPEPLLLGVAVAASTAFATPVASPVNALVLEPGGYRFRDFLRAGLALQFAVLLVCGAALALGLG